jgi:uncharacterized protein YlbG (UPF0298 family)
MMKIKLRGILFGVIILLLLASSAALAQTETQEESKLTGDVTTLATPPMSPFIFIRIDSLWNRNPSVAYNSKLNEFLVVWEEEISGAEMAIYGRRVSINGQTIGNAFPIAHNPLQQNTLPDVAYSSKQNKYLVTYTIKQSPTDYDIAAQVVRWNGDLGLGFFVDYDLDWDWYPAVAYNVQNDEFLVVWEKCISCQGGTRRDIEAQRIKASDWSLLSWRNIAGSANMIRQHPDVAYNAARNEYLIAYSRHLNISTDGDIVAKRSDFNMSWLSGEIQITPTGYPPQSGVALAAGPDEYMAVWTEDYGTKSSIWARRVGGDGSLHSFISLANDNGLFRLEPAVAFGDGGHYLVAWRHVGPTWDIFGRYVVAGNDSPEGPQLPIEDGAFHQKVPALACSPSGPCLEVQEDNFLGGSYDIMGRLVGHRRIHLPIAVRR